MDFGVVFGGGVLFGEEVFPRGPFIFVVDEVVADPNGDPSGGAIMTSRRRPGTDVVTYKFNTNSNMQRMARNGTKLLPPE